MFSKGIDVFIEEHLSQAVSHIVFPFSFFVNFKQLFHWYLPFSCAIGSVCLCDVAYVNVNAFC